MQYHLSHPASCDPERGEKSCGRRGEPEGDSQGVGGMKGSQALEKNVVLLGGLTGTADWHTVLAQLHPLGSPVNFFFPLCDGEGRDYEESFFSYTCALQKA